METFGALFLARFFSLSLVVTGIAAFAARRASIQTRVLTGAGAALAGTVLSEAALAAAMLTYRLNPIVAGVGLLACGIQYALFSIGFRRI